MKRGAGSTSVRKSSKGRGGAASRSNLLVDRDSGSARRLRKTARTARELRRTVQNCETEFGGVCTAVNSGAVFELL
eukprot:5385805-Prymnesium_polylepis.1